MSRSTVESGSRARHGNLAEVAPPAICCPHQKKRKKKEKEKKKKKKKKKKKEPTTGHRIPASCVRAPLSLAAEGSSMAAYANEVRLFGKWTFEGLALDDIGAWSALSAAALLRTGRARRAQRVPATLLASLVSPRSAGGLRGGEGQGYGVLAAHWCVAYSVAARVGRARWPCARHPPSPARALPPLSSSSL